MILVAGASFKHLLGDLRVEFREVCAQHVWYTARLVGVRRIAALELLCPSHLVRILVGRCSSADRFLAPRNHVHSTPVSKTRHPKACHTGQSKLVIERGSEYLTRLGEERQAP